MARISFARMQEIADKIAPCITPIIEEKGSLSHKDICRLAQEHDGIRIASERTTQIIDNILCGELI